MKTTKTLSTIAFFIAVATISVSILMVLQRSTAGARVSEYSDTVYGPQRNTLLIIVDRLDIPSPKLRSAWLVAQIPSSPNLTFLPIHPSVSDESNKINEILEESFGLEEVSNNPYPNFLNNMHSLEIYWHEYIIVDEIAFAGFVDLLNGVNLNHQLVLGDKIISGEFLNGLNSQGKLHTQAELLAEICRGIPLLSLHPDLESTLFNLLSHSNSTLKITDITQIFSSASYADFNMGCEFPNLESYSGNIRWNTR